MTPKEYWQGRSVLLSESLLAKGEAFYKQQAAAYELARTRIRKEIEAFYGRFAKDNVITYAQAKRLLTSDERRGFVMDVDEYVKKAEQIPYSPEWSLKLENASNVHRLTRLEYLDFQMRQQVEEAYAKYDSGMTRIVTETFEEGYYRNLYEGERAAGKKMPFATLDTRTVQQVVNKPWSPDGINFSGKIWVDRDKLVDYLHTEMTQMFIRGESSDRLVKEIEKRFGVSEKNAERLILTETAYFASMSDIESYKTLGYKKYIIIAELDERTSAICREMNDEVFNLDDFQPGVTAPPLHPRCRSTTAPYVEKDNGVVGPGMVKDPNTGELVKIPRDESYREWLDKRLAEEKKSDTLETEEADKREEEMAVPNAKRVKNVVPLESAPVGEPILIETITPEQVDEKLREYVNIIKDNDFETAYVITEDYKVYRSKGIADSVSFNGVSSKGAYILHNHPINLDGYADSFSDVDYDYMTDYPDFKEMLLVTPSRLYVLHLLKLLDIPTSELYKQGLIRAFDVGAYGYPYHYMMIHLKELGYVDYTWEEFN